MTEDVFPKPGYVKAVVEALNKSSAEKMKRKGEREDGTVSRNSTKSLGLGSSLMHTRSTLSVSSSMKESLSEEFLEKKSDELEALYKNQYPFSCGSKPNLLNHFCQTRTVCVCHKRKCSLVKNQKKLSKSLNALDEPTPPFSGNLITKYFTSKKKKKTHEARPCNEHLKTQRISAKKLKTLNLPLENFQIIESSTSQPDLDKVDKSTRSLFRRKFTKKLNKSTQRLSNPFSSHTALDEPGTSNGIHASNGVVEVGQASPKSMNLKQNLKKRCVRIGKINVFFLIFGLCFILIGATYDLGLRYVVDSSFNSCWKWLREDYSKFGGYFLEYQKRIFSSDLLLNEEFDERFFYILESTEFSIQIHFFDIIETSIKDKVRIKDIGPLYFKMSFKKNKGLVLKYMPDNSNLTLFTKFELYDIMKALSKSNQLPYLNFHLEDYIKTTPSVLLNAFVDTLNKYKVDTSLFSTLKAQIQENPAQLRQKRSDPRNKIERTAKNFFDKIFLPLPLDTRRTINFPVPIIKRNLTLKFKSPALVSGLEGYQFVLKEYPLKELEKKSIERTIHPKNELIKRGSYKYEENHYIDKMSFYKKDDRTGRYNYSVTMPANVINLNPILLQFVGQDTLFFGTNLKTFPFWISSPHFLFNSELEKSGQQDESFWNSSENIEGLIPNEAMHGSFVYYHPILGVPMNASIAFQIGIFPPEDMLYSYKLVPIMWIRIQMDQMHPSLWYLFWASFYIRIILILLFIWNGLLIIVCGLKCKYGKRTGEEMV